MTTAHMRYVICPKCGDVVAGLLPPDDTNQLTCIHCKATFPFDAAQVRAGLVTVDDSGRWKVAKPSVKN
jgi:hypothetical protein